MKYIISATVNADSKEEALEKLSGKMEAANEEFQLVISSLGYMDAMSCEEVLQGIGYLLEILIPRNLNHIILPALCVYSLITLRQLFRYVFGFNSAYTH